jgi:hypothetical protein
MAGWPRLLTGWGVDQGSIARICDSDWLVEPS